MTAPNVQIASRIHIIEAKQPRFFCSATAWTETLVLPHLGHFKANPPPSHFILFYTMEDANSTDFVKFYHKKKRAVQSSKKGGRNNMTDQELRSIKRPKPEDAAKYLANGTTAQNIRIKAQQGKCPYCEAFKPTGHHRYSYTIFVEALIKCKHYGPLFQNSQVV